MEEARITITVKPIFVERIIYWVVIALLLGLLLFCYLKSPDAQQCAPGTQQGGQGTPVDTGAQAQAPAPVAPSAGAQGMPAASCANGVKDGSETDVDCGGSCGTCASGKSCSAASDCSGGYCVSGACASSAPQQLSGSLALTITNVAYSKAPNGRLKITGVSYTLANGLSSSTGTMLMKLYVKTKSGSRCLNQQTVGSCDDSYAEFTTDAVAPGKSATRTTDFDASTYTTKTGAFLLDDNGYSPLDPSQDSFTAVLYVYDANGDQIGGKTISASRTENPA